MAALNFPNAPAYGDVYSKWTWDGARWTCGQLPPPPAPDWVPQDAVFYIDFVGGTPQGRGWDGWKVLDAVGIGEVLGTDPVSDLYQGGSRYDASGIVPPGDPLIPPGYDYKRVSDGLYSVAIIGKIKEMLQTTGMSVVMQCRMQSGYSEFYMPFIDSSGEVAMEIYDTANGEVGSVVGSNAATGASLFTLPDVLDTPTVGFLPNRVGVTLKPTITGDTGDFDCCVNGSYTPHFSWDGTEYPYGPQDALYIDGMIIETIAFYNPMPWSLLTPLCILPLDPIIETITPTSVAADPTGLGTFDLSVTGNYFTAGSVIHFDGAPVQTFYGHRKLVSAIDAPIPTAPKMIAVTVVTPEGRTSALVNLEITAAAAQPPTITSIFPTAAVVGGAAFTLTVNGTNFAATSVINAGGVDVATTFVDAMTLTTSITPPLMAGNIVVYVRNADGSVSSSFEIAFTEAGAATASITRIDPRDKIANGGTYTLTIYGTGFTGSAVCQFDGVDVAHNTAFVTPTLIRYGLVAPPTGTVGIHTITVKNGDGTIAEGSGTLEWVDTANGPSWAKGSDVFIDFVDPGRIWNVSSLGGENEIGYAVNNDAESTTYLGGNNSGYDTAGCTWVGYDYSALEGTYPLIPAYLGTIEMMMLSSGSLIITARTEVGAIEQKIALTTADAANVIEVFQQGADLVATSKTGGLNVSLPASLTVPTEGAPARNRFGFTYEAGHLDIAANGTFSTTAVLDDTMRPPANPFAALVHQGCSIESVEHHFPALPIADLLAKTAIEV